MDTCTQYAGASPSLTSCPKTTSGRTYTRFLSRHRRSRSQNHRMKNQAMSVWSVGVLGLVGLSLSCAAGGGQPTRQEQLKPWSAPPLERVVSVFDGRTGERLEWSELLDELARAEAVFLGEQHTDETTHRVELAVYEGLLERRDGAVVLAMEMFERDAQAVLDQVRRGRDRRAGFPGERSPLVQLPNRLPSDDRAREAERSSRRRIELPVDSSPQNGDGGRASDPRAGG